MFSFLLAIVYMAFISLGLPDSLLGASWSVVRVEMNVPVSYAGYVTMIIAGSTIVSSLFTNVLTRKLGTGLVTAISVTTTAVAMVGFSFSTQFWHVCLWAIPYGLGAGAVDASLNNYAALHFSSRHMNWLHCFWGVGAAVSPYIMGACLTLPENDPLGWQNGYRIVGGVQVVLSILLFCTLPLWKKCATKGNDEEQIKPTTMGKAVKTAGVWQVLIMFFAYCAVEQTTGIWASTYLVEHKGVDSTTAAFFASMFYLGITVGRFVCGLFSNKLGDNLLIRVGSGIICVGIVAIALPLNTVVVALVGLVLVGVGCAPIYPAIIHSSPTNFGAANSQAIIGLQMACAYVGTTFMPPLFGWIAESAVWSFPLYLAAFTAVMVALFEWLNLSVKRSKKAQLSLQ